MSPTTELKGCKFALEIVAGVAVVVLVIWTLIGPERRDADFVAEAHA